MRGGCCDVAFEINRDSARRRAQARLLVRCRGDGGEAEQVALLGREAECHESLAHRLMPGRIGGEDFAGLAAHAARQQHCAGRERRIDRAGDAEAQKRVRAVAEQP